MQAGGSLLSGRSFTLREELGVRYDLASIFPTHTAAEVLTPEIFLECIATRASAMDWLYGRFLSILSSLLTCAADMYVQLP